MTDAYTHVGEDLRKLADRVEQLRDPKTLAGAQAELERRVTLIERELGDISAEVERIPHRLEEIILRARNGRLP